MAKNSKPNKNSKVNTQTGLQQFADFYTEMFISIYVFILLAIYPLYYHNKYFDMGDAKFQFFKYISFCFLGALIIGVIIWIAAYFKSESFELIFKRYSVTDWFAVAFLIISYVSFICSEDKNMAFYGFPGWSMGLLSQLMFFLIYIFTAKYWKWSPATLMAGMFAGAIAYFLAVVMRFGFDPLEMYTNLSLVDIEKFISTLGQTTWYSSYAVLIFPVGVFWYFYDERKWVKIFTMIFISLGTMSLCTAHSDSAFIAFPLIMLVFFWFAFDANDKMLKFLEVAIVMLVSCRIVGILEAAFPERTTVLITGEEKISKFVTASMPMLIVTIIVIAAYIMLRVAIKNTYNAKLKESTFQISKFKVIRVVMVWAAVAIFAVVILLVVLVSNHLLPAGFDRLYNVSFFVFDDIWGNHRGFNWRAAVMALKNASLKDLLIGVGPDCFAHAMDKYYAAEVAQYWQGLKLACAHNEFLNMLVTEGILGFIAYMGFMISSVVRCAKAAKKENAATFVMAIVLAYIGHNVFCYQQCICTPIMFLFVGIGEVIIRSTKEESV